MNTVEQLQAILDTSIRSVGDYDTVKTLAKRVVMSDGESVSVQANKYAYCSPRSDEGPYYQVELGFPSCVPTNAVMQYCEDDSKPTATVYGYVPIQLVAEFIDSHGGIKQ